VTNETQTSPASKPSISFNAVSIRLRNVLQQGVHELVYPNAAGRSATRSAEAIEITDQGVFLALAQGTQTVPLTPRILAGLAERANPRPVDLVFRDNSCIDVTFSVPPAPLPELRQMIATEVQFRSPFAEAVALSFWSAQEQAGGRWQVRAAVLLKTRVTELLADLQSNGIALGQVWREGTGARFAAEPDWATGPRPAPGPLAIMAGLPAMLKLSLAGSAVFLVSALLLTLSLGLGAGRLSEKADAARASLSEKAQTTASMRSLDLSLARSADRLAMTGRLTALLPDGYWLDQLAVETDTVTLTGYGPSAAEVTRLLTTLPELSAITFASPVTRDNTQSLERYRIAATLAGSTP
jgi:Fimbrial assembly protein (PilN)